MANDDPTQLEKSLVSNWTARASRNDEASWRMLTRWLEGEALGDGELAIARAAARKLVDDDDRIRTVLGHCPTPVAVLDGDGAIVGFNRAFRALTGTAAQLGASVAPCIGLQDRPLFDAVLASAGTTQRAGATMRIEVDGALRDVEFLAATIPDAAGVSKGVVLALEDQTAASLLEGERSSAIASIALADREAALALAAATLVHDVGNLVSTATIALEVVSASRGGGVHFTDAQVNALFDDARSSLDQANRVLRDARDVVSGRSRGIGAISRVDEAIDAVAKLRERDFRRAGVRLEMQVEDGLVAAIGGSELKQVLANLIDNGLHAIEDGHVPGTLAIRAERGDGGEIPMAIIHVVDDGVGIDPGRLTHVFDPFETSRAGHGGTGLGLAIVKRVVENAGGRVQIVSLPHRGTEVVVHLPSSEPLEAQTPIERAARGA